VEEVTPGNLDTSSDNNIIHDIKINEEYANLVPQLSISEYKSFKEDIKQNGVQVPIITNQDGVILDGHHRYRAWVIDLGRLVTEMPKPTVADYNDKLQEKMFVINVNLKRRQLNSFQRISLALKAKPILEEIAKRNQKAGIKIDNDNDTSVRNQTQVGCGGSGGGGGGGSRVDEQIGKRAGGVGKDTVRKVEIILEKGTKEQIYKLEHGKATINSIAKQIHDAEKRRELILLNNNNNSKRSNLELPENIKLLNGDFTDSNTINTNTKRSSSGSSSSSSIIMIQDNSIPLIFTDPPYQKASLPLYRELGKLASRVLIPGGSLMVLSGQLYLPEVLNLILESKELRYWWSFAVIHPEGRQHIFARKVFQGWKHLLWFVKGEKGREGFDYIADSIKSARHPHHKYLYEWQQSTDEVEYIIRGLTVENEVILDPMLGSGTTAIAALKLNRRFIGIEIQKNIFNIAKSRISEFLVSSSTLTK
jgi:16S rRNA G966 N2-methylase RsmD